MCEASYIFFRLNKNIFIPKHQHYLVCYFFILCAYYSLPSIYISFLYTLYFFFNEFWQLPPSRCQPSPRLFIFPSGLQHIVFFVHRYPIVFQILYSTQRICQYQQVNLPLLVLLYSFCHCYHFCCKYRASFVHTKVVLPFLLPPLSPLQLRFLFRISIHHMIHDVYMILLLSLSISFFFLTLSLSYTLSNTSYAFIIYFIYLYHILYTSFPYIYIIIIYITQIIQVRSTM